MNEFGWGSILKLRVLPPRSPAGIVTIQPVCMPVRQGQSKKRLRKGWSWSTGKNVLAVGFAWKLVHILSLNSVSTAGCRNVICAFRR
ncbi:hypothetical protein UNSWDHB_668 [Dehalobacter sp. UNSWDHB]|nr:hypothetical protein UNSWDHB_668 [Dehalobacter sp. UNSWDHB]